MIVRVAHLSGVTEWRQVREGKFTVIFTVIFYSSNVKR